MPLLTRCRASLHARSGRPTITNAGVPSLTCASTSTRRGSRPTRAWVTARASTPRRYVENRHETVRACARDRASSAEPLRMRIVGGLALDIAEPSGDFRGFGFLELEVLGQILVRLFALGNRVTS